MYRQPVGSHDVTTEGSRGGLYGIGSEMAGEVHITKVDLEHVYGTPKDKVLYRAQGSHA